MSVDARLADMTVLLLAVKRRLALRQVPDWRSSIGMSSLLEAARALPVRDPWSLPDFEEHDGLAGLLAEARRRDQEGRHGA